MYNYRFNIIMRDVLRGDNSKQTNKQTKITDCMSPTGLCTLLGLWVSWSWYWSYRVFDILYEIAL